MSTDERRLHRKVKDWFQSSNVCDTSYQLYIKLLIKFIFCCWKFLWYFHWFYFELNYTKINRKLYCLRRTGPTSVVSSQVHFSWCFWHTLDIYQCQWNKTLQYLLRLFRPNGGPLMSVSKILYEYRNIIELLDNKYLLYKYCWWWPVTVSYSQARLWII